MILIYCRDLQKIGPDLVSFKSRVGIDINVLMGLCPKFN